MKKLLVGLLVLTSLTAIGLPEFSNAEAPETKVKEEKSGADTYELLNLFGEVFDRVKEDYVEEVSDEKLIESAINGMLTSLDPHSSYLSNKDFEEMQVQTKGEFGGLGIEVTMENGLVKVVSPIDDTPAFKAGVEAGDYISHIDDEQIMGMTLSEAVEKMRGQVGASIKLTILREGASEPIEKTMVRDVIKIETAKSHLEGDDIGYLRITSFAEKTATSMRDKIAELEKQNPGKLKGYVLDLRNNPGGLLDQAIEVADTFLDQGEIVSTKGRTQENDNRYNSTKGDLTNGKMIVVLINGGSASAAEIVAGALQDHKRAIVMGTKSFGKGSVQTVIPLVDHGAMRLTTSRYYTPSGRSIQAEGIEPDIEVLQGKVEYAKPSIFSTTERDLSGHLENDKSAKGKDKAEEEAFKKPSFPGTGKKDEGEEKAEDFQLLRAMDLIRGSAVVEGLKKAKI